MKSFHVKVVHIGGLLGAVTLVGSAISTIVLLKRVRDRDAFVDKLQKCLHRERELMRNEICALTERNESLHTALSGMIGDNSVELFVKSAERISVLEEKVSRTDELVGITDDFPCFDDMASFSPQAVQRILKEVNHTDLMVALLGASPAVLRVVFENVSKRMEAMLREDIEHMSAIPRSAVKEAKDNITACIRNLKDNGSIIIDGVYVRS